MTRKNVNIPLIYFLALVFFMSPLCHAQGFTQLNLEMDSEIVTPPKMEYKLSLGSQMISDPVPVKFEDIGLANNTQEIRFGKDIFRFQNEYLNSKNLLKLEKPENISEDFSTLTLTTDYLGNSIGINETEENSLSIRKRIGKWSVYGEFERKSITKFPIPKPSSNLKVKLLSNIRSKGQKQSFLNIPTNEMNISDKNSALASRYYLEAVYNFLPTVKGKVSYKRSMIDNLDSEEKLQVEGIVEANRNMLIKAGYNNETRPELADPKTSKDAKVWTEFILKF